MRRWIVLATTAAMMGVPAAAVAAPAPPGSVEVSAAGASSVTLTWEPPSGAVSGFRVERSVDGGKSWSTVVADTGTARPAWDVTGLKEGAPYAFRVRSVGGGGVSAPTTAVTAIPCRFPVAGTPYRAWTAPCWAPGSGHPFGDVQKSWQQAPVAFLVANDITSGTSPTTFSPADPVTRGQVAAFLWRLAGRPTGYAAHGFTDVTKSWQQAPIRWMKANGITSGTSPTTFSPDDPVTRGEMAAFLWRLVDSPWGHAAHPFADVSKSWQEPAVRWLTDAGVTQGTSSTTFSPSDSVTRGQMAAFIHRLYGNLFRSFAAHGAGDEVLSVAIPNGVTSLLSLTHDGASNFIVEGYTDEGDWDLFVNEIGRYTGTRPFNLNSYYYEYPTSRLEVTADGNWTVVVRPLGRARTMKRGGAAAGRGDAVLVIPGGASGRTVYSHIGDSNFVVLAHDGTYWGSDLQVNEIGDYQGADYLPAGTTIIDITADGDWKVDHTG